MKTKSFHMLTMNDLYREIKKTILFARAVWKKKKKKRKLKINVTKELDTDERNRRLLVQKLI